MHLVVADTGMGIDRAFLPYVFERFSQEKTGTDRPYGGLGLGLAIVRQLVELRGGTVRVHSDGEGQGASFLVNLPIVSGHKDALGPVHMEDGHAVRHEVPAGHGGYLYVLQGRLEANGERLGSGDAAYLSSGSLELSATVPSEILLVDTVLWRSAFNDERGEIR